MRRPVKLSRSISTPADDCGHLRLSCQHHRGIAGNVGRVETAFNIALGVVIVSSSFVAVGLLGKVLLRDVSLDELRTDKIWRGDPAAWSVRLLRPATMTVAVGLAACVVLLIADSL